MLLSIGHVSRYTYSEPAGYLVQSLRLTPPNFDGQRVHEWSILAPGIEKATRFTDCFGNAAHLITATDVPADVVIIARGVVETRDMAGIVKGAFEPMPVRTYMHQTEKTKPDEALRELAHGAGGDKELDRMHNLMHRVREVIDYKIGATSEHTSAAEALADGQGVCQDHAHVFITCARVLGIPARYVNGYFLTDSDGPAEAHHAWAEAWVDGLGWIGFDAANEVCPTERYVRLAAGLDAAYAAPIRGTRRGGAKEVLDVLVEVQQQSNQQQ
jgi:transglutaminase-like putative cysteine protease